MMERLEIKCEYKMFSRQTRPYLVCYGMGGKMEKKK